MMNHDEIKRTINAPSLLYIYGKLESELLILAKSFCPIRIGMKNLLLKIKIFSWAIEITQEALKNIKRKISRAFKYSFTIFEEGKRV